MLKMIPLMIAAIFESARRPIVFRGRAADFHDAAVEDQRESSPKSIQFEVIDYLPTLFVGSIRFKIEFKI